MSDAGELDVSVVGRYDALFQREAYRRLGDRELAREVSQTVMMAYCQKGRLEEPYLGNWLRQVFENKLVDARRNQSRRSRGIDEFVTRVADRALPQAVRETNRVRDLVQFVRELVELLPARERDFIKLRLRGYTCREIGEQRKTDPKTVSNIQRHALVLLRERIGNDLMAELRSEREKS
jgi:RNA polymerase sigma factor (sigma-70 family)